MEVEHGVLAFFEERGLAGATEAERLDTRYLEAGLLDSMEIVMMIAAFEEDFGIQFDPEDFEAEEFGTVGGLIGIIERARGRAAA